MQMAMIYILHVINVWDMNLWVYEDVLGIQYS